MTDNDYIIVNNLTNHYDEEIKHLKLEAYNNMRAIKSLNHKINDLEEKVHMMSISLAGTMIYTLVILIVLLFS